MSKTSKSFLTGMKRGIMRRCPNCGKGHLFAGYIKIRPTCSVCHNQNGAYRADDGPAWLTIIVISHFFLGPIICSKFIITWSAGSIFALILPLLCLITLLFLPLAKGMFIGIEWARQH